MADKARKLTDKELNKLEREIYELYATASNEISAEWRKYMASHKKTLDQAYNELQEAKKSGDRNAIAEANEKYERTVKNVTLNDIRYKAMLNETTAKLANVNQLALDYINGDMPKIYTLNYNAFGDEKIDGYTFTLVNERAIAALALSNEIRLPKKKVNIPKDEAWNAKNINSQLMQGILQGESIAKIAKRLQNVTNMNRNSAIRNARTMTTGAENQGRQDSFKKASSDGVLMKRRWVATHDERVRAWHSDLDGVEVDIDEPFQNDFGDIMFPGDPTADAANVYNCRCSIRAVVKGFKWNKNEIEEIIDADDALTNIKEQLDFNDIDFQTLIQAKEEAGFEGNNWNFFTEYRSGNINSKILDDVLLKSNQVEKQIHETVQGKDISNIWTRRSDEFDFAIDDILNAQGFDGLPQVVSSDEFNKFAKESNFIMQRTYSASNQEILSEYRDQLYDGKWYVDCSNGGAAYGEGMYTFSANSAIVTDDIKNNIDTFISQSNAEFGKFSNVETMTFTKDAKIISIDDLLAKFEDEVEEYAKKNNLDYFDAQDILAEKFYNRHEESGYIIDLGVYGSAKGYDAITSYDITVVLNRTKLIIKGD